MLIPFHDDNASGGNPVVTLVIIILNVLSLTYVGRLERSEGTRAARVFVYRYGFIPRRMEQLARPVVLRANLFPEVPRFDPRLGAGRFLDLPPHRLQVIASVFTAMFLHANWMHLIGNMWFLWLFGNNIEHRLGHVPYLLLYLLGGVVASGVHWAMTPPAVWGQPVIGASGAVAVILGAYAVTYPFARIRTLFFFLIIMVIDVPALVILGSWFVIQLLNGIQSLRPQFGNPVAWWAHIGGFALGAIVMPLFPVPGDWRSGKYSDLTKSQDP